VIEISSPKKSTRVNHLGVKRRAKLTAVLACWRTTVSEHVVARFDHVPRFLVRMSKILFKHQIDGHASAPNAAMRFWKQRCG